MLLFLTLEQYRLFISVCPWRQPSLNYKLLAVLSGFFFPRVSLLDIFSPSFRLQLCVQFLGSMYSATSDNMKLMFARVSRCFARDSTGVLYFGWWVICKQKVWQGYQMCSVIRSDNLMDSETDEEVCFNLLGNCKEQHSTSSKREV